MNKEVVCENWLDIEGYEGMYMISDFGNVYSYKRNRN
jgi:hypothetical protein